MQNINTPTPSDLSTARLPRGFQFLEDFVQTAREAELENVHSQLAELTVSCTLSATEPLADIAGNLESLAVAYSNRAVTEVDWSLQDALASIAILLLEKSRSLLEYQRFLKASTGSPLATGHSAT